MNPNGWDSKYAVIGEGVDADNDGDGGEYLVIGEDGGCGQ
jgi:hypothetical protein